MGTIAITPVLLCGGSGTRLWPVSRKAMPKQFSRLVGEMTLYQAALSRSRGSGWRDPVVITSEAYLELARLQAEAVDVSPSSFLVEPSARNTAPAILAAAFHTARTDPEALMLIAPSDHAIPDAAAFRAAVHAGADAALAGNIVTFGIRPTRAETGYGWLELDEAPTDFTPRPMTLAGFVEKPGVDKAEAMLAAGRYLWNSGIFLASAGALVHAFEEHAPDLVRPVRAAVARAANQHEVVKLAAEPWGASRDISVDYAVMEHAPNLCVVPFAAGWSDLGDWNAIWRERVGDEVGVVTDGAVTAIGCENSLIRSDVRGLEMVGIGLKDIVAVAMDDTVLVAHRDRAQDVKQAVAQLKARGAVQAGDFAEGHAGRSETEANGTRYTSRCLQLAPGEERVVSASAPDTRWIVLAGRAVVNLAQDTIALSRGATYARRRGQTAQLCNPDTMPLVLVEMQEQRVKDVGCAQSVSFGIAAE